MTCGDCEWGKTPASESLVRDYVLCAPKMPMWVANHDWVMSRTTPADHCPCFERKEEK